MQVRSLPLLTALLCFKVILVSGLNVRGTVHDAREVTLPTYQNTDPSTVAIVVDKRVTIEARKFKFPSFLLPKKPKTEKPPIEKPPVDKPTKKDPADQPPKTTAADNADPTSKIEKPTKPKTTSAATPKSSCSIQTGSAKKAKGKSSCGNDCSKAIEAVAAELAISSIQARDGDFIGGMSGMIARAELSSRSPKTGKACGKIWNADEYPEKAWTKGTFSMANQPKYGWELPEDCTSMKWGNPLTAVQAANTKSFEIEHVMEWQLVTRFFEWISERSKKEGKVFPDPARGGQTIDFCAYFANTFDNSNNKFALPGNPDKLTAQGHMAAAFPSKKNHPEEFVFLEKAINKPAKANVYSYKREKNVFDVDKTVKQLKDEDGAEKVIVKLKALMAVRKYLKDPKVKGYFKVQKERMGKTLDELDTAMQSQPKVVGGKKYEAWKKKDLKKLWDDYMDERFQLGVERVTNDMVKYLPVLQKKYGKSQRAVLKQGIKTLASEWKHEKTSKWEAPWAAGGQRLDGLGPP